MCYDIAHAELSSGVRSGRVLLLHSQPAGATATLLVEHIAALREAVATTRQHHPFTIDAFVVLPDHLHAVWTLPPGDSDFSTRWRLVKSRSHRGTRAPAAALRFTGASPNVIRYGGTPSSMVRAACISAVAKPSVNRS
jgi:hypothetical protein